ncbi:DUF6744 family protein [Candidatus Chloroploca sp. Khr17]|uniref:DUF6744 family protein n=1 Tax=Candidatus Chloroploca sp. Khr17 TaxID=2496869 RepID=UPI00101CFD5C|nr:DUF6744 family protein [Candidatus Chloroploca sp. Khr17]
MTTTIPLLGYHVWWSTRGLRVSHDDLLNHLNATGFGAFAPALPTDATALKRAIYAWLDDQHQTGSPLQPPKGGIRNLVRPINTRSSQHIVFALVGEAVDFAALGLSYGTQARILLEKLSPHERLHREPALICTTAATGVIAAQHEASAFTDALRPRWRTYQTLHLAGDLTHLIRTIIDAIPGAVCVRREGGLFFVPVSEHATLLRLRQLVAALPTDGEHEPYVELLGVPDEAAARRTMARAVHRGMLADVQAMQSDLNDLQRKAKQVKASTIAQRLSAYQQVIARAQLYADLLGMHQQDIQTAITDLSAVARALLLSDTNAPSDRNDALVAAPIHPPDGGDATISPTSAEATHLGTHPNASNGTFNGGANLGTEAGVRPSM